MAETVSEVLGRIYYEDILFRAIEDCRRARVYGELARYSEAVLALFDVLSPKLREKVEPIYAQIREDAKAAIAKTEGELHTLTNPLEQAGYYQYNIAAIERENTDKLFKEIIRVLDEDGMLLKRRELLATKL